MTTLKLTAKIERLPFAAPFRIAGFVFEHQDALVVTLEDAEHRGRGEACGVFYLGETAPQMLEAVMARRSLIEAGIDRTSLQRLLPPGGVRNAVDCALWELEACRAGKPVWELVGMVPPKPLLTTFTLGADSPEAMAAGAHRFAEARALKVKLTGELDLDAARIRAVRSERPEVWLGVDANQAYRIRDLEALVGICMDNDVRLLEQPLARGREADLEGFVSPVPIAADESVLSGADVPGLVGRFNVINIKLDKSGGLTEALEMAQLAHRLGLGVMVGNMMGSSLATAPAFLLGQLCDVVDLDGPIFLRHDRSPGVVYEDGMIWCDEAVWGGRTSDAGGVRLAGRTP